jgi:transcriptional regulator with XRE-family HTH domain/tetratricopeptide (TPR) repeat protein
MSDETVGEALKRWRLQRHLSLRRLADLTNYTHVYLWEIERGTKPPQSDLIARCDRVLAAGGQLIKIAAAARAISEEVGDETLGLVFAADWSEGIATVTNLWRFDVGRRRFIRNAVFASTALAAPVQQWLSLSDVIEQAPDANSSADADAVRQMTVMFRRLDNLYGGGQIRTTVVQYLDANVAPTLRSTPLDVLGGSYLSAVAELTQLAGWLAYDGLDHGLAQRYFIQSLRIAMGAKDRSLGAEILAGMSHQAIFLGQPEPALRLAQAAHATATRAGVSALVAEAAAMTAHAHALTGNEAACTIALTEAEQVLEHADQSQDPQWISYLDEAYLAAISGHCFRTLGKHQNALKFANRSLDMNRSYVRGQLFNTLLLAGTHVLAGDVDQACTVGHDALDLAETVSSGRVTAQLGRLMHELRPWQSDRRVKELTEHGKAVTAMM